MTAPPAIQATLALCAHTDYVPGCELCLIRSAALREELGRLSVAEQWGLLFGVTA